MSQTPRRWTLAEEVSLLTGRDFWRTRALPGLPSLFLADGPHGLRKARDGGSSGLSDPEPATCFPTASGLACTWDPDLVARVGAAIGREARALGVHVVLGPGVNLQRHPLGGRNFEYFSEDPLLSGTLAAAMVRGIQSVGVGACVKHFVANNQEDHRMVVDVRVDARALRELYLRGFELAVAADPAMVMACYNRINGTYGCEHPLLGEVLRGEWGFRGVVVSDWGAVDDRVAAVAAGCDLEMPSSRGFTDPVLMDAIADGSLSAEAVHACVDRIAALQDRVGGVARTPADLDAHHALAREAAGRVCVLLKNERDVLPLTGTVAVVGPMARAPRYQGAGSSGVRPTRRVSVWDALSRRLGARATWADTPLDAARADVAVVVTGLPPAWESEGFDRRTLDLPAREVNRIRAVAAACHRVVVVLCNGAPVTMPWADEVDGVLEAFLGGQAGGEGVADVLLGQVNPSGKLAATFPLAVADLPSDVGFPGDGTSIVYREGLFVGYRYTDTVGLPVRFPFGHGLSYTTFELSDLRVRDDGDGVAVFVTVTNTGDRRGAEVVQVYVRDVEHTVVRPLHELAGFARVEVEPGASVEVRVDVPRRAFAFWDVVGGRWAVEAGAFEIRVGTSSRDLPLRTVIDVASEDGPFAPDAPSPWLAPVHPFHPTDDDVAALLGAPLPIPRPPRPFTRRSTLGQVRETVVGGVLYRIARWQARRTLAGGAEPALQEMADAMVRELPLRAFTNLAGVLSWRSLDALIALLNGRLVEAIRIRLSRRP